MPLGQLMRRAVTYMHHAGADGSTAPLASRKKNLIIFGSPIVYDFIWCSNILISAMLILINIRVNSYFRMWAASMFTDSYWNRRPVKCGQWILPFSEHHTAKDTSNLSLLKSSFEETSNLRKLNIAVVQNPLDSENTGLDHPLKK